MRILILSGTCSKSKYKQIYETRTQPMLDSNQKFFMSLIDGFSAIEDVHVDCITTLPISHRCYKKRIIRSEREVVDGVSFQYCGCLNYPVIRTLTVGRRMRAHVKKYLRTHAGEQIVVLCDGLIGEANALVSLLRRKKVPAVALVTDVPNIVCDMNRGRGLRSLLSNVYGKRASRLLCDFDGYVFLTEQMNEVCNPHKRPYTIMECIVTPLDIDAIPARSLADRPVALYAGKLHSDFGVLTLAQAAAHLTDVCEVWLYGGGEDCQAQLQQLAAQNPNLKLHGIVPLSEIHEIERNCAVLVNPRPNEKEFTKYSFPSKTAEYLMMRVPVVMHRLDGIPAEYDPFLHYIKENTPEGIAQAIRAVLANDATEQAAICAAGRSFILEQKNHNTQAQRIVAFLKDM